MNEYSESNKNKSLYFLKNHDFSTIKIYTFKKMQIFYEKYLKKILLF